MTTLESLRDALADRYTIERELGAGGMATVYLAQDLKHHRKVAIKVLKPELAAVLGAERFVQEITTTAALQHPHILPLFDSGSVYGPDKSGPYMFYVMPFIDGETLRAKLDRETQLGIDEAVKITVAVADALDYAHRHGVIHRDIKPENILLHEGRPMVADFGIALAVSAAAGGRMTETGLSLGTPHYMSPEQATAEKEISARSDVYSLGSVLYEMLTGNPPHTGASAQQIIMKIVTEEAAPVTKLRKAVPPNIAAAVATALEKLPADRFVSAAAFSVALTDPGYRPEGGKGLPITGAPLLRRREAILAGLAGLAVVIALWGWLGHPGPPEPSPTRFALTIPEGMELTEPPILSPDGRRIVYAGDDGTGPALYLRSLDRIEATRIEGTEEALQPFFSPDGEWIGFVANRRLHKISLQGGARVTLADAPSVPRGASWGPMDSIAVTVGATGLALVSAAGGALLPLTLPDQVEQPQRPQFIGRGDRLLLSVQSPLGVRAAVLDRSTGTVRLLDMLGDAEDAHYVAPNQLIYRQRGRLLSVRVHPGTLEPLGPPTVIATEGGVTDTVTAVSFDATPRTLVVSRVGSGFTNAPSMLFWVDSTGAERPVGSGNLNAVRLSPDGRHAASDDGWVLNLQRGTTSRLAEILLAVPVWTPDGRRVVYGSGVNLVSIPNRLGERPEIVLAGTDEAQFPHSFSPDGSVLASYRIHPQRARDIYTVPMSGDRTAVPWLVTEANERSPAFSPDGKWIAYTSDLTGADEVYLRPYPGPGPATPVSAGGGREPVWAANGRKLYYRGQGQVMGVEISHSGGEVQAGPPAPMFRDVYVRALPATGMQTYSRAADGRFLMHRRLRQAGPSIRVTEHWRTESGPDR